MIIYWHAAMYAAAKLVPQTTTTTNFHKKQEEQQGHTVYLFDNYPVTESDVNLWLDSIPRLSAAPFRREAYRKAYRIEDKIRAAKAAGLWPPTKDETWHSTKETTS